MSIKIIVTDLDGTLMSADHLTVSPRTVKALQDAHNQGVKLAIATGRPMALVDDVVNQVPFVDYVIYANGASVYDRNEKRLVYTNLIENKISTEIISYLLEHKVFFEIYIEGKSHYQLGTEGYLEHMDLPEEFVEQVIDTMTAHKNLLEFVGNKGIEKITLYSITDSQYPSLEGMLKSYRLETACSFPGNLEATAYNTDKASAVENICNQQGILQSEAMTFGDAGNDCTMLRWAEYSFAMGNATEECKKTARFVTDSNADDGLAKAVEKYVLKSKIS